MAGGAGESADVQIAGAESGAAEGRWPLRMRQPSLAIEMDSQEWKASEKLALSTKNK